MKFKQLFKQISIEEFGSQFNIFKLLGENSYVVTAGNPNHYNSMVGSGGGFGLHFKKATVWCIFRSDRYTLELIENEQVFTLSFFRDDYKQRMMFFARTSGRSSNKMSEAELFAIETPAQNISFEEAHLIIECKLTQITTPVFDDFYSPEARDWLKEIYKSKNDYRKYVFGEITYIWIKNNDNEYIQ